MHNGTASRYDSSIEHDSSIECDSPDEHAPTTPALPPASGSPWVAPNVVQASDATTRRTAVAFGPTASEPAPAPSGPGGADLPGGDGASGEQVPYYYSSKYARLDYLPRDLDYGKAECLDTVRTYIGYVFDPPDGAGDPLDNAQHLRGACARLRIGKGSENATLLMLDAFSVLAVETAPSDRPADLVAKPLVREAIRNYRTAYRRFERTASWQELLPVLLLFSEQIIVIRPSLSTLMEALLQECVLYRTVRLLRDTNCRLLS